MQPIIHELKQEFSRRCRLNPQYSMRAYAKFLGVSPGTLSELMAGKRPLTKRIATRVAKPLNLSLKWGNAADVQPVSAYQVLADDKYALISDWFYYGILNLMKLPNFRSDASWIARQLGLKPWQVKEALERLEGLEIIEKVEGKWIRRKHKIETNTDVPSSALRESHRQCLDLAQRSLENDSVHERDITSMTMTIPQHKMDEAKSLLRNFRHNFQTRMEAEPGDRVYNLCLQLYPISKGE